VNRSQEKHGHHLRFLTVPECAALLRVTPGYIYHLTAASRIPCFRVGRRVLFDLDELTQWLRFESRHGGQNGPTSQV